MHNFTTYPADQAALDKMFSNRARWPDFPDHIARWQRDAAAALAAPGWSLDLPYGPGPREVFDILRPDRRPGRGAPLFAFIHGGYWMSLDKAAVRGPGPAFAARGIAYASLEYALCPDVSLATIVAQTQTSIRHLHRQASALGVDPNRIYVGGHSAGGHLAAMLACDAQLGVALAGYFSVSGVYDLAPIQRSYLQPTLNLTDDEVATLSPLKLRPKPGVRFWATVGSDELEGFTGQQADLVEAWGQAGCAIAQVPAPGLGHFDIVDRIGDFDHPIGKAVLEMIES